jgi:hypothetical protein
MIHKHLRLAAYDAIQGSHCMMRQAAKHVWCLPALSSAGGCVPAHGLRASYFALLLQAYSIPPSTWTSILTLTAPVLFTARLLLLQSTYLLCLLVIPGSRRAKCPTSSRSMLPNSRNTCATTESTSRASSRSRNLRWGRAIRHSCSARAVTTASGSCARSHRAR